MSYNQRIGRLGEDLAVEYLEGKKYKVIDRNVKISYQELDVVAYFKDKLVFVEVKTRVVRPGEEPGESMDERKIDNLITAIMKYVARKKHDPDKIRLDLINIDIDRDTNLANIEHYLDIF